MRLFLNAGFGAKLGAEARDFIVRQGFYGVRQDVLFPDTAAAIVRELSAAGLAGLYICSSIETARETAISGRTRRCWIELGNEADDERPRDYQRWLSEAVREVRSVNPFAMLYTAGITTTDRRRIQWLEEVFALGVPDGVGVAVHTYRTTVPPETPHPGYLSRADEYEHIREIIGPHRSLIVSEAGWHTAPSATGGWLCNWFGIGCSEVRYSEQEQADFFEREYRLAEANGVDALVLYQLNCGPNPDYYEHGFGIRRLDGSERPICQTVRRLTGVAE